MVQVNGFVSFDNHHYYNYNQQLEQRSRAVYDRYVFITDQYNNLQRQVGALQEQFNAKKAQFMQHGRSIAFLCLLEETFYKIRQNLFDCERQCSEWVKLPWDTMQWDHQSSLYEEFSKCMNFFFEIRCIILDIEKALLSLPVDQNSPINVSDGRRHVTPRK